MLTACKTPEYAQAPINLSPGVRQFASDWLSEVTPLYLAVSKDGRRAHGSMCPDHSGCIGADAGAAIAACERVSGGVPCVIYGAMGRLVVADPSVTPSKGSNNLQGRRFGTTAGPGA